LTRCSEAQHSDATSLAADVTELVNAHRSGTTGNFGQSTASLTLFNERKAFHNAPLTLSSQRTSRSIQVGSYYKQIRIGLWSFVEEVFLRTEKEPPAWLKALLQSFNIELSYLSLTRHLYLDSSDDALFDNRRRLKVITPFLAYHFQTSSLLRQLNYHPIIPCHSKIFKYCMDGDLEMMRLWFKNGWALPTFTNQHGENLLHVSYLREILYLRTAKLTRSPQDTHIRQFATFFLTSELTQPHTMIASGHR
jgi:hypothetical protein